MELRARIVAEELRFGADRAAAAATAAEAARAARPSSTSGWPR